jgi:3-oxoacyl-[acyl-carrier protein] reductase
VDLAGRVALVTGSSGGIGRVIALTLARAGADVAVNYRRHRAAGEQVAAAARALGVRAAAFYADAARREDVRALVAAVEERFGRLDVLVNNVGEFAYKRTAEHSDEEFERIMAGTIGTTFYTTLAALPGMRRRQWGRVINIGASGAQHALGSRLQGPHLAGKSAVISLTRTLALEEGRHGITFNAVVPGIVEDRQLTREEAERRRAETVRALEAGDPFAAPAGRPGTSEDVADAVLFLARPQASFINGAVLEVTGGWYG